MPVYQLDERLLFPPAHLADPDGVLAVGGDLSCERLLLAYEQGIFPWYSKGLPILWHCPDPRMVLEPDNLHTPRSLQKSLRQNLYEIRCDTAFDRVVERCATVERPGQEGTWITDAMKAAYIELHENGFAHSTEAWRDGQLVGGLYGVSLGSAYFGESMFSDAPDASKAAFVTLVAALRRWGFTLIDCQVYTPHLAQFGAQLWPRAKFLDALKQANTRSTRCGQWSLTDD